VSDRCLSNTTTVYENLRAWECYLLKLLYHKESEKGRKWDRKNIRMDIQKRCENNIERGKEINTHKT
jgi:hypothetical protein